MAVFTRCSFLILLTIQLCVRVEFYSGRTYSQNLLSPWLLICLWWNFRLLFSFHTNWLIEMKSSWWCDYLYGAFLVWYRLLVWMSVFQLRMSCVRTFLFSRQSLNFLLLSDLLKSNVESSWVLLSDGFELMTIVFAQTSNLCLPRLNVLLAESLLMRISGQDYWGLLLFLSHLVGTFPASEWVGCMLESVLCLNNFGYFNHCRLFLWSVPDSRYA